MARKLLTEDELAEVLPTVAWERRDNRLIKITRRDGFRAAVDYVNQVADLAEAADHHPNLAISWDTVTLELWTHVSGGITQLDVDLATRIDALG